MSIDYPFTPVDRLQIDPRYTALMDQPLARIRLPYGGEGWLATRYADVCAVLARPEFSRAATVGRDVPRVTPQIQVDSSILGMDPPEQTRIRRLVASAFTAHRVRQLAPRVREIVDDLLDRMLKAGPPAELVETLAVPLPMAVIGEVLGVPESDRPAFRAWTDAALAISAYTAEEIRAGYAALDDYFLQLIAQRRANPAGDLLTALIEAHDAHDRLSEQEVVRLCAGLVMAGYETTAGQLSCFLYLLLSQPEHWARLAAEPSMLPVALEELLRYVPFTTTSAFARIATEDVELGGVVVRAGEAVFPQLTTANRDPAVFERPDELDLTREANPHIGFGYGPHRCLGAQLARMELHFALEAMLQRLPRLTLAVPVADVEFKTGRFVRCPVELPISWD